MHVINKVPKICAGSLGVTGQEWRECVGQTPQNACDTCWLHLAHDGLCCGYLYACLSFPLSRQRAPVGHGQSFTHFRVPHFNTMFCTQHVLATAY